MPKTILITGATGMVSSGIIAQLKDSGYRIRALLRNPEKAEQLQQPGVEIRAGDMEKPWTLAEAFEGADTVWILAPPGPRAPEQCSNALWAAKNAGVSYIVRMSAIGAAHDAPTINGRLHALSDAELLASGIPCTILKPHFFMQNLFMAAESIAQQSALYFALADGRMGMIDARDVSEFGAHVLSNPGHEGKTYTLTGPASESMHEVAEVFSDELGKTVGYVPVPIEAAWESIREMGMDESLTNLFCEYFRAYSSNWGDLVTDDFARVMGRAPRSSAEFVRDFAGVFGK